MNWLVYGLLGLMAIGLVSSIAGVAGGAITAATAQPTPTATPVPPEVLACRQARLAASAARDHAVPATAPDAHEQIQARQNWIRILDARASTTCRGQPPAS